MENWEVLCDKFFEKHEDVLVADPRKTDEDPYVRFLWDDYEEVKKKLREISPEEPGFYCYTLVEDDGNGYIIPNWHFVNRLGYFISTVKAEPDICVRYW